RNSLGDGLRSRVVFPEEMAARIDDRKAKLTEQLRPRNELENMLIYEISRTSVQEETAEEKMLLDDKRVRAEDDTSTWDDERTEEADALGARLGRDPYRHQKTLARSKHGAKWLLDHWIVLNEMLITNGCLNDLQRAFCFDLLGVPLLGRDGTARVPAGDDA